MQKHNTTADVTKYVVAGMVIGSAVGTAVTVMMKSRHPKSMIRTKAAAALDTVSTIMQNVADFTR
ncbi:MAG: hypothetical protein IKL36_04790 [Clostridia bacterium]|nr:hypothetical protein [Clostridia bacterium]